MKKEVVFKSVMSTIFPLVYILIGISLNTKWEGGVLALGLVYCAFYIGIIWILPFFEETKNPTKR